MIADAARRPVPAWVVWLVATAMLAITLLFGAYAAHRSDISDARQRLADQRAEKQRQAICAILANIPGQVPAEIAHARDVFARPGHPNDCAPLHPIKQQPVTVRETNRKGKTRTVTIVVVPQSAAAEPSGNPPRSPSPSPSPKPKPSRKPSPRPSPSPSPSCRISAGPICIGPHGP